MPDIDLTPRLIKALSQCFYGAGRPTHGHVDQAYRLFEVPLDVGVGATNKEGRVAALLGWVKNNASQNSYNAVEHLVYELYQGGHFDAGSPDLYIGDDFRRLLDQALGQFGYEIAGDGTLVRPSVLGAASLPAGREHVDAQIARLQRSTDDPAALIGHTKDLLETVAKTVLLETGGTVDDSLDFSPLLSAARAALPLMPATVPTGTREYRALERFINGIWTMANSVNELRNAVGTGHGQIASPSFDAALAATVSDGAIALARLWLQLLEVTD